jgi:acyl-CoA synthetase (NDP forming)
LPPVGSSSANPIDTVSPFPSSGALKGMLEAMAASGEVGVMVLDKIFLSSELRRLRNVAARLREPDDPWLSELPMHIQTSFGLPVVVVLRANLDPNEDPLVEAENSRLRHEYQRAGIAVFPTADRAFRAIGHVVDYHRRREERRPATKVESSPRNQSGPSVGAAAAKSIIAAARGRGQTCLSEHEAKEVLKLYGIPVTREVVVTKVDALAEALDAFEFPVVLKVDSPDILHKTEAGLVSLGCASADEAEVEFLRIMTRSRERYPTATINGVLVQEMVTAPVAECIVGAKKDAQFGPTVLFGLGGIFVEVFEDVSLGVAPLSREDAASLIREIKGFKILSGARSRPKADVGAAEDVVLKLSRLALDLEREISEIDVNPLMVLPEGQGVMAVDALIVLESGPGHVPTVPEGASPPR